MKISFSESTAKSKSKKSAGGVAWIITVEEGGKLSPRGKEIDSKTKGAVKKAIDTSKFKGKAGQFLSLVAPAHLDVDRLVLAGIGKEKELTDLSFQSLGGGIVGHLEQAGTITAELILEETKDAKISTPSAAANAAYGAVLRSYRFDKYRTKEKQEVKPTLNALNIQMQGNKHATAAAKEFAVYEKIADGVFFTRNLVSEPANIINPETLADQCKQLSKLGVDVDIFSEADMRKLGMNALLGVGQGSAKESKMVILRWNGAPSDKKAPLAFVGKGVTFDTGGISIKPAGGMEEMKWDMGGAGVVIGLMRALAARKAKVNVIGAVGLVENMPDGNAQRPGDVVKSMSGQTIEVINTDAEGRLVLADVLWFTQSRFKPRFMIDLATLTGAVIIALGSSRAGLMSNNDKLAEQLFDVGKKTGEEVWRLPLGDVYDKQINSDIADMQNVGEGREAGTITAAQFLQRFVNDVPWAHLDIAGVAWSKKNHDTVPKGATAFGVRLLDKLVSEHYEK